MNCQCGSAAKRYGRGECPVQQEIGRWRGGCVEQRRGLPLGHSWPLSQIKGLGRSLRAQRQPYLYVAEEGYLPGGMKRRVLRYLYQPCKGGELCPPASS